MLKGRKYKHINNTDVVFEVITHFYSKETDIHKVKGLWYNIVSPYNVFPIERDKIKIKGKDRKNWKRWNEL